MKLQRIGNFGALGLALTIAGSASAASFVDITYDLSDTTILNGDPSCSESPGSCTDSQLLAGTMTVRYTSNSQSSMPIVHGPATLLSWTILANVQVITAFSQPFTLTQAINMKASLLSPVAGSLISGGTLTFGSAQIGVTGGRHCPGTAIFPGLCVGGLGTLTSVVGPLGPFTKHASFTLAASAGPYGGAQSTRQTISGSIPLLVPSKYAQNTGSGGGFSFATHVSLVGREILRVADGHDPKVTPIPEPGTLLLLSAATGGLALVGRATRRPRRG